MTVASVVVAGALFVKKMFGSPFCAAHVESKSEFRNRRVPCVVGFFEIGTATEYWCPPR